jgi:hypothetical protein
VTSRLGTGKLLTFFYSASSGCYLIKRNSPVDTLASRGIVPKEANPMYGVFQNIDPPPPSLPGECVPPRHWCGGEDTLARGRGWWGSIVWKTPDTALYSIYVSTLCFSLMRPNLPNLFFVVKVSFFL